MPSFVSAATVLGSFAFSAVSVSASIFNAAASNNLAVYWGQGNAQKSLGYFCSDDTIDIIPIGFVNVFPDEAGSEGYPGTNFGNACGGFYTTSANQTTQLLASCPGIEADIKTCQANGKKILLSLGGGSAAGAYVASDTSAVAFADFLWGAFGPQTDDWVNAGKPRPFGDAVIDGFDFDIESLASDIPTAVDAGYAAMANEFRRLFDLCTYQTFYLSAAPQCIVPDGHLADAISKAVFDFLFVQFYNTPQCSARAHFDSTYGQAANGGVPTDISYDTWVSWVLSNSANKATKVYIGLPAAPGAAESADYLSTAEAGQLITDFKCKYPANFGGVMLWEATYSDNNQIGSQSYAQNIKPLLTGCSCLGLTTSSSVTSTTSTTLSTSTTSTTPTTSTTLSTSTTSTTPTTSTTLSTSTTSTTPTTSTTLSTSTTSTTPTTSTILYTSTTSTTPTTSTTLSTSTTSTTPTTSITLSTSTTSTTPTTSTTLYTSATSTTPIISDTLSTSTISATSTTTSSTWSGSYFSTWSSSFSTPASPASSSTTSSTTTSSSSTAVGGVPNSSSTSTTLSSTFSTPTGWSTFGTYTSSTYNGLAAGPGSTSTSAAPTSTGASWSVDPSSTSSSSSTLTSTSTVNWPNGPSTSTTTSVTSLVTMTIVPVPSSVWYASTLSSPASIPISLLSLVPTATAASSSWSSSSSSTVKAATGSSVSSWATTSVATTKPSPSSTTAVPPMMSMKTVSIAQGATWSSDPSMTLSVNAVQTTSAAPFATFKGAASGQQVGARDVWVVMGVMGLVGALVL